MSQVFLSYRHVPPDEQLAEGLCAFLQERGLRVFLDKQIRVGLDWVEEIDLETLHLDEPTDPPIEGDPKKLLEKWQARLGLIFDEQMRPVPRQAP